MTLLTLISLSFAYSSGKTGSSTAGCTCHGAASADTAVSFSTSSTTVAPGDVLAMQFIVENSGMSAAGLDISVSGGTLAAGANTQLSGSEITHTSPEPLTATFEFTWTAPATDGTYTFYGAGNAVNENGGSSGDEYALTTFTVDVVTSTTCADNDTDGYTDCDGDCVDNNAAIHPGQSDICDGTDTDCDGTVDDDAIFGTRYTDADSDGFGDPATGVYGCDAPTGTTADNTDCDDSTSDVRPSAPEIWYDGVDQNCDGNDDDQDGDGSVFGVDCDDQDPAHIDDCDTGTPTDDTGPTPGDSGSPTDSGDPTGDSGNPSGDSGNPSGDSGNPSGDSGNPAGDSASTPPKDEGCGCNSGTPMAALLPLLLAALAGRRRVSA